MRNSLFAGELSLNSSGERWQPTVSPTENHAAAFNQAFDGQRTREERLRQVFHQRVARCFYLHKVFVCWIRALCAALGDLRSRKRVGDQRPPLRKGGVGDQPLNSDVLSRSERRQWGGVGDQLL